MARFVGSMCGESCPCAERRQRCPSDGEGLRMPNLYFKNEGLNPTGSFKDRGTLAGMQRAAEIGARAVLILVEGDEGDLYHESVRIGDELGICFISSDDPFRVEGQRTVALEICEQIGGEPPDYIFMPLSSGGNMSSVLKGLAELRDRRAIDRMPKVIGVQAEGAAPMARALAQGKDRFESLRETHTICKAITNPNPPSGNRILMRLEGGKLGSVVTVTDEEALGASVCSRKLMASGGNRTPPCRLPRYRRRSRMGASTGRPGSSR